MLAGNGQATTSPNGAKPSAVRKSGVIVRDSWEMRCGGAMVIYCRAICCMNEFKKWLNIMRALLIADLSYKLYGWIT